MAAPLRVALCVGLLSAVSACAGGGPRPGATAYRAGADYGTARNYAPPGPPTDPWGPYIIEASNRFTIPDRWIREVMRRESGGQQYINGRLTTSAVGAIGLMQVMPRTYEDLRIAHKLGPDPYDPHDNILAGTAYIRDMYERFGSPGFLAAYNAGPQRLADFMSGARPLPGETVAYLAAVAPRLGPAMQGGTVAVAQAQPAPAAAPASVQMASAETSDGTSAGTIGGKTLEAVWNPPSTSATAPAPVVASAPAPARLPAPILASAPVSAPAPVTAREPLPFSVGPSVPAPAAPVAAAPAVSASAVSAALVSSAPTGGTASAHGQWAVQVGAFSSAAQAQARANSARNLARGALDRAQTAVVTTTRTDGSVLYRARLAGITADAASNACDKLAREQVACIVVAVGGDL